MRIYNANIVKGMLPANTHFRVFFKNVIRTGT